MPTKQNTNQRKNMHKMVCSSAFENKQGAAQARWCAPLLPAGREDRQVDLDEFQASLVCISSTRPARLNESLSQKKKKKGKYDRGNRATTGWTSRHHTQKLKQNNQNETSSIRTLFPEGP